MASASKIPDDIQKRAIAELNEVPERIPQDLEAIRTWLSKQAHLNCRPDDRFLLLILRGCKFSLEKSKVMLDNYLTLKTALPEYFKNYDPKDSKIKDLVEFGVVIPLSTEKYETKMFYHKLEKIDPAKYHLNDIIKLMLMSYELTNFNSSGLDVMLGHIYVIDLANVKIGLMAQATPQLLKKNAKILDAFVVCVKELHFVNPPPGFDTLFKLFSGFVDEKIRHCLFSHDSLEKLYKVFPKNIMPKEYGGDAGTVDELTDKWYEQLMSAREYFLENSTYGTIESLRPGLPKTPSTLFGVDGSFRSLDFD